MSFGICWKAYRSTPSKGNGFGREQNVQREKNGLISINPFSASRKCARNSPAARSRSSYLTGSIWATIRKTTPRPSLTNSTSSLSGGLPTIAERQKPQKNTRELVTLELFLRSEFVHTLVGCPKPPTQVRKELSKKLSEALARFT